MKILYLLRHAASSSGGNDVERDLTIRGNRQAESTGRWMFDHGIVPDLIFSSPAKRAELTAKICAEEAGFQGQISLDGDLYEAHADTYLDLLAGFNNKYGSVMIVGHNPEISDIITVLTGNLLNMSPCTLVCIEFAVKDWGSVRDGNGVLKWVHISS